MCSVALSSLALASSWPKGFSTTSAQFSAIPLSPSIVTMSRIAPGGTLRYTSRSPSAPISASAARTARASSVPSSALEVTKLSREANPSQCSSSSQRPYRCRASLMRARNSSSEPGEWRPEPMIRKSSGISPSR